MSFFQQILQTSTIEWVAFLFALLQVVLAYKNNKSNFIFGFISVLLYCFIYFEYKLYAEMTLNVYYALMSIYGWIIWKKQSINTDLQIAKSKQKELGIAFVICIISFILFYFVLKNFTDSSSILLDSAVSAFAWAGTWLLAKRKLESWLFLNISNAIAIPLLFHKQLSLTSLLVGILFIVACFAYFDWRKQISTAKRYLS